MLVDGSEGAAKQAIDGDAEGGSFTIHSSAAADYEIRVPDQVQTIQRVLRNDNSSGSEKFRLCVAQFRFLFGSARQQNGLHFGMLLQQLEHRHQELFALWIVIMGFAGGRTKSDHQIGWRKSKRVFQGWVGYEEGNIHIFLDARVTEDVILPHSALLVVGGRNNVGR